MALPSSDSAPETQDKDAKEKDKSRPKPWTEDTKEKFRRQVDLILSAICAALTSGTNDSKPKSEFLDPCQEAAQRSYKCLYRNGGDRTMCGQYFK
ncbi:hypothetical protein CP533_6695 [Ophiocordyceps camponoti-saundersi (nom. inval.)]|nr:hypothetical protein CP533_6695 [Ophiocordyceps camponoti-saundersi (nom. inval.)]